MSIMTLIATFIIGLFYRIKLKDTFEYKNLSVVITKADEFIIEQIKVIRTVEDEE